MRLAFLVFLLGLALLLFAPKANAQVDAPPCLAGLYGVNANNAPKLTIGRQAMYFTFVCKKADGTGTVYTRWVEMYNLAAVAQFTGAVASAIASTIVATTEADIKAAWAPVLGGADRLACTDAIKLENSDRGRLCVESAKVQTDYIASFTPPAAPAAVWKVKPNGTYPDRPVSVLSAAGGLTVLSGVRVLVGAPCDITKPSKVSGANTYASIDPAHPERVAVCIKT